MDIPPYISELHIIGHMVETLGNNHIRNLIQLEKHFPENYIFVVLTCENHE